RNTGHCIPQRFGDGGRRGRCLWFHRRHGRAGGGAGRADRRAEPARGSALFRAAFHGRSHGPRLSGHLPDADPRRCGAATIDAAARMSRETLLSWIETDRDLLVDFLSRFIRVQSPNPPGDTREAAQYVQAFLDAETLPHRVIAPEPTMPNIVASFDGRGGPG